MQNCYGKNSQKNKLEELEEDVEVDERLTKKHIHTLKFLQDIVNENKDLKEQILQLEIKLSKCEDVHISKDESKERILKVQEDCLKRSDEIHALVLQRHRTEILQKVEEHLNLEDDWKKLHKKQEQEIKDLKEILMKSQNEIQELDQTKLIIQKMKLEMNKRKEDYMNELQELKLVSETQSNELNRLTIQEKKLVEENYNFKSEREALKIEINLLKNHEHEEFIQKQTEYEKLISDLKTKIAEMVVDRKFQNDQLKMLQLEIASKNEKIEENEQLRQRIMDADKIIYILNEEIKSLKSVKSNEQGNFREFIEVKRELALIKNEYANLKNKKIFSRHESLPKLLHNQGMSQQVRKLSLADM